MTYLIRVKVRNGKAFHMQNGGVTTTDQNHAWKSIDREKALRVMHGLSGEPELIESPEGHATRTEEIEAGRMFEEMEP